MVPRPERDETDFPFGRRVLITEDNWLIANEWRAEFELAGYVVTEIAVSADEVERACAQTRPDFVLMDIRLLGARDGVDAALAIRRALGTRSVFISAHDDAATHARGELAEPLGWIVKPVIPARLPLILAGLARPKH
ncbi:MAG TPA: response regulator [Acetobacteraceae bacterium]|nr:response regulator [Acetobacteraceae bacterium]